MKIIDLIVLVVLLPLLAFGQDGGAGRLHLKGVTLGMTPAEIDSILRPKGWYDRQSQSMREAFRGSVPPRSYYFDVPGRQGSDILTLDYQHHSQTGAPKVSKVLFTPQFARTGRQQPEGIERQFNEIVQVYGRPDACQPPSSGTNISPHCTWTRVFDEREETLHWRFSGFSKRAALTLEYGPGLVKAPPSISPAAPPRDALTIEGINLGMPRLQVQSLLEGAGFKRNPNYRGRRFERQGPDGTRLNNFDILYDREERVSRITFVVYASGLDFEKKKREMIAKFGQPDSPCRDPEAARRIGAPEALTCKWTRLVGKESHVLLLEMRPGSFERYSLSVGYATRG